VRLPIFLLSLTLSLSANGLDDLRAVLAKLRAPEPVKVSLEHSFWKQIIDNKKPVISQGRVAAQVEENSLGLRIIWARPTLQQAARELDLQELEPDRATPTRTALKNVDALEVGESLNHAEALLRDLTQAQVQEEKVETWQGRPVKVLVLKLLPKIPDAQRKYMKEVKVEGKVWIGADGFPLAYSSLVAYTGSRLLISFEGGNAQDLQFAKVGNRLLVTKATSEEHNAGFGASTQTKKTMTLTLR
jgi:hypothetical protein